MPEKAEIGERIRLEREIHLFERWIKATGELETLGDRTPDKEALKIEIRKRLSAYLAQHSGS